MANEDANKCDVSNVILQVNDDNERQKEDNQRRIKRVLHFSDGDLIEYEDDEADAPKAEHQKAIVDPKTLPWSTWTFYQTAYMSSKLLEGCDYVGEALAKFFGITSPKYQFEIDEYHRQQKILAKEREKEQLEMNGWNAQQGNNLIESQPTRPS